MNVKRSARLLLVVVSLALVISASGPLRDVARGILGADALNATDSLPLPAWLEQLTQWKPLAYPIHVAIGASFETLGLSPAATAVQWLKAAGHVRTDAELERAVQGIVAAVQRDRDDARAQRMLCIRKELGSPAQVKAVERAGLSCDRWPPPVLLEARAPQTAPAGSTITITAAATSRAGVTGLVVVEVHDLDNNKVAQWVFPDQTLGPGQRHDYVAVWDIPANLPVRDYQVKLGVIEGDWRVLHVWKNAAAVFSVTP